MIPLSNRDVEQALGRAALVVELEALERRLGALRAALAEPWVEGEIDRLSRRAAELVGTLWPEAEPEPEKPQTVADQVAALAEAEVQDLVRGFLRRRPEVTPPEEGWTWAQTHAWIVDRLERDPRARRDLIG